MPSKQANSGSFREAEYLRTIWQETPQVGTQIEALLLPEYWCHVASQLRPGHRIEVVPQDGAFYAELFVTAVSSNRATVKQLAYVDLFAEGETQASADVESKHKVQWMHGALKFSIISLMDNEIIKSGFTTKADAANWLVDYEAGRVKQ